MNFSKQFSKPESIRQLIARRIATRVIGAVLLIIGGVFCIPAVVNAQTTEAAIATPGNSVAKMTSGPSQSAQPTAAAATGTPAPPKSFTENIRGLHLYSYQFLREMIEQVEKPTYISFEFLAKVLAGLVFLFSFLRLIRENDGASKELYYWGARAAVCLAFITLGPSLINTLGSIGHSIAQPTQRIKLNTEKRFNADYERYVMGNFMIDPAQVQELMPERGPVAVLKKGAGLKLSEVEKDIDVSQWELPYLFMGLNISRGILAFADLFLLLLTAFVAIGLRLAVPFMIAVAIDQKLAQRITYPFIWGTIVLTIITPIIIALVGILVYGAADIAVFVGGRAPARVNPETHELLKVASEPYQYMIILAIATMLIGSLSMFAAPYMAYRVSTGQVFEAISTQAGTWMTALVGSGVEFMGLKAGASLQRQAEATRIEGAREGERVRLATDYNAGLLSVQARQTQALAGTRGSQAASLGQIYGGQTTQLGIQQALNKQLVAGYGNQFSLEKSDIITRTELSQKDIGATRQKEIKGINAGIEGDTLNLEGNFVKEVGNRLTGPGGIGSSAGGGAGARAAGVAGGVLSLGPTVYGTYEQQQAINLRGGLQGQAAKEYAGQLTQNQFEAAQGMEGNRVEYRDRQVAVANTLLEESNVAVNRGVAQSAAGVRKGTEITIGGINEGAALERESLQTQLDGRQKAADIQREAGLEAARLNELSSIITGVTRDIDRRLEEGMRASTRY